ncbi:hypothetical protein BGZ73_006508 [Actinomortierella ambigua]|nr:hypothetical protein BGZ73_006508 [Actinomortierella ambigua]
MPSIGGIAGSGGGAGGAGGGGGGGANGFSDFPGGSYQANNHSSPGRLDHVHKVSDPNLQLQYGSRVAVRRADPNGGSGVKNSTMNGGGGNGNGNGAQSAGGPPTGMYGAREQQQQHQPRGGAEQSMMNSLQGDLTRPPSVSPQLSQSRTSAQVVAPGAANGSRMLAPHLTHPSSSTPTPQQQQQQQQQAFDHLRAGGVAPLPWDDNGIHKRINGNGNGNPGGMMQGMSPLSADNLDAAAAAGYKSVPGGRMSTFPPTTQPQQQQQQQQQIYALHPHQGGLLLDAVPISQGTPIHPHLSYIDPSQGQQPLGVSAHYTAPQQQQHNNTFGSNTKFIPHEPINDARNGYMTRPSLHPPAAQPTPPPPQQQQSILPPAQQKFQEMIQGAGGMLEASRPGGQQVFATLAQRFPTNPREAEKRTFIHNWMQKTEEANQLSYDNVYRDELDDVNSPFFINRITYELGIMASIGKHCRKIIDVNCSGGEWALDMAIKYPKTIVYAIDPMVDFSRIPSHVPDNVKFKARSVLDQYGEFDFVHQRLVAFRTPFNAWTPHFAELGRLTRQGGWIQLAESDGVLYGRGAETLKLNRWVEQAALSAGLNPKQLVEALMPTVLGAGLINVEQYRFGIPAGSWGGERGQLAMATYLSMVEALRMEIIEMARLDEGVLEQTIEAVLKECDENQTVLAMTVICAQKPPCTDDIRTN